MIKSIEMKKCATYTEEGAKIENCQKVNFFYGPNGSGKSTISNFLYNQSGSKYEDCKLEWENNNPSEIIVYNREFRERNFKEDIKGVFTLGEATIEEVEALEEMKKEKEKKKEEYLTKKRSLENKINEEIQYKKKFTDWAWENILKKNETDFQEAFSGFRKNKEKFKEEVIERYKKGHSSKEKKESLIDRATTLFSKKPEKCSVIDISAERYIAEIEKIEKDSIWEKIVVGNTDIPIAKLIEQLDNADWVNKGRLYLSDSGICPFCQQKSITDDLENQLNLFFSGEYENDVKYIEELIEKYKYISNSLLEILSASEMNDYQIQVGKINISQYKESLEDLKKIFDNILKEMVVKQKEASKKVCLAESLSKISKIIKMISDANDSIINHNNMVDHYNEEKEMLVDDVWEFLMSEYETSIKQYLQGIKNYENAKKGINNSIELSKKVLDNLEKEIVEAGTNITSVQPTVDEINRLLKAYGFTNFQIVPSDRIENSYQIQRMDGTLATDTLSEGEETFISFLYFLQFAKGSTDAAKVSAKKILVLDDPICSLDSTVLYIVSSMVKALIKSIRDGKSDVEQIFILTHNVFFHKEASFIDGRTKEVKDVNYWIISKDDNISSVRAFERINPIKTSYQLLWQELKTNTNASLVTTQNIMRRIIENYFGMLGSNVDDNIVSSFSTAEEQMICRSLISWINDGSHSIPDDLYIDSYTDSIERYKTIFKDIFVKMGHSAHYNMMMS